MTARIGLPAAALVVGVALGCAQQRSTVPAPLGVLPREHQCIALCEGILLRCPDAFDSLAGCVGLCEPGCVGARGVGPADSLLCRSEHAFRGACDAAAEDGGGVCVGASPDIVAVARGQCVLTSTGRAICRQQPTSLTDVVALEADQTVLCGLHEGGEVSCVSSPGTAPIRIPSLDDATQIAVADSHQCALRRSGQVVCWGQNGEGQLGDGTTEDREEPVAATGIDDAVHVAVHQRVTCAALATGRVRCWGTSLRGHLGEGIDGGSLVPVEIAGIDDAVEVALMTDAACARRRDGHVACWGSNAVGQLGLGDVVDRAEPSTIEGLEGVTGLHAGFQSICATDAERFLWCWGVNHGGRLGFEPSPTLPSPVRLSHLPDVRQVALSPGMTCALLGSGEVRCWGDETAHGDIWNYAEGCGP